MGEWGGEEGGGFQGECLKGRNHSGRAHGRVTRAGSHWPHPQAPHPHVLASQCTAVPDTRTEKGRRVQGDRRQEEAFCVSCPHAMRSCRVSGRLTLCEHLLSGSLGPVFQVVKTQGDEAEPRTRDTTGSVH